MSVGIIFIFAILLLVGLVIAAGLGVAFAIARHRKSAGAGSLAAGAGSLVLSAAAIGFCLLLLILFISVPLMQHSRESARRAETQARLVQMGEELHARDTFEEARRLREHDLIDALIPVEAVRPQGTARSTDTRTSESAARNPLPEWVSTGDVAEGDRRRVVISGEQFADPRTARDNALSKAERLVRDDFEASHGATREPWSLNSGLDVAVKNSHTETIRRTAGDNEFTVYRTHLLVELSPQVHDALEPIWRQQIGQRRSVLVVGLLALLTAIAAIVSGYFRLDDRTGGRYRWRLRLGAIAATILVGGTLFAGTRLAAEAVRPPDPLTVQEARMTPSLSESISDDRPASSAVRVSPHEMHVDDEVRQKFRVVADRIVDAINAGDYEDVRRDFNENMLDRFPPEKCREFFREKIADKYGTIHTLEPAQFKSSSTASYTARCERGTLRLILVLDEQDQVAGLVLLPQSAPADARG